MILTKLSAEEISALESTRMNFQLNQTYPLSCKSEELFDDHFLLSYLEGVKKEVQAPDLLVAASIFSKRYSLVVTLPALMMMTVYNKRMSWKTEDLVLTDSLSEEWWLPGIFHQHIVTYEINDDHRLQQQEILFEELFAYHLSPLWSKLNKLSGIPVPTLWENAFSYIKWFYETVLPEKADPARVEDDFEWIGNADGNLFASRKNPFQSFWHDAKRHKEMRRTCCFAYKCSSDKIMCNSCPKK
ncbi:IucA/IucC family C-terminal-domain containing protein [Alkalihalophilus pseudofirmus]|uniref:IucA/IucC family C-terminal-domain containing protein n=1 Tax=Alkalihalophilus pseudofirmus TaxID=79885 RepID=A0AAJ2U417_ALKPS|nr:IucA/IucC family C-terminal-domain containing protein [Alkalihalophilus pseudofirmus]MDV2886815.1 IucA/IucC family C-terminal-domain containing protein [Alkalihalophilus pseudofirmus]